ncbi:MAG TPA: ABC transporter C-terminal domain-containing protein, partial [Blastocatellia bacterium]|nr:ABC transporter C-terminal domain-containing protein [Blastocatellia bacterium]
SAEQIEQEISAAEAELRELTEKLANPAADWGPDQYLEIDRRQAELTANLEALYREWETASAG